MGQLFERLGNLFDLANRPDLGPSRRASALGLEEVQLRVKTISQELSVRDAQQQLLLSALLLWHDHLDASHSISQEIQSIDGSFLHAIMHRREPDFWNSKYWWRRVGNHPIFPNLGRAAFKELDDKALKTKLLPQGIWDPFAFVDAVEAGKDKETLSTLQALEMQCFLGTLDK